LLHSLINTAPVQVVDLDAILSSLVTGQLGGFGLDYVDEGESEAFERRNEVDGTSGFIHDDTVARLANVPNAIITLHQAYLTTETLRTLAQDLLLCFKSFAEGKRMADLPGAV
jgi:D-lactate dehydrogenase